MVLLETSTWYFLSTKPPALINYELKIIIDISHLTQYSQPKQFIQRKKIHATAITIHHPVRRSSDSVTSTTTCRCLGINGHRTWPPISRQHRGSPGHGVNHSRRRCYSGNHRHTRWTDQNWPDAGRDNPLRYCTKCAKSQQARPRRYPGDKTIGSDDCRGHDALCPYGRYSFLCHRRHRWRPPRCRVHYGYLR